MGRKGSAFTSTPWKTRGIPARPSLKFQASAPATARPRQGGNRRRRRPLAGRTRGFRASCKWGRPASRLRPKPSLHASHPVWSPSHLTSFILTEFSVRECTKADNQGPPDRSMNGRKHLLLGLRRKERAELWGRTAEMPRPRGAALPSAREERHCGPWRLAVCLATAEGV